MLADKRVGQVIRRGHRVAFAGLRASRGGPIGFTEWVLYGLSRRDQADRFKDWILRAEAATKLVSGKRSEAAAYWRLARERHAFRATNPELYDENYYQTMEDANYERYIESSAKLVSYALPERDEPILDFGCGRGFLVAKLKELGYQRVSGCELSENAIQHAVTDGIRPFRGFEQFQDKEFGITCLISVLEHISYLDLPEFLSEIARITSRKIVCCIPVYPNNLSDFFFRDADHQIFERRAWWDEQFMRVEFAPVRLPAEPLPFVEPFIYERLDANGTDYLYGRDASPAPPMRRQPRTSRPIHFDVDMAKPTSFTWITAELAQALIKLGHTVTIRPGALSPTLDAPDQRTLDPLMGLPSPSAAVVGWHHYFEKGVADRDAREEPDFEFFVINYEFQEREPRAFDSWMRQVLSSRSVKLCLSRFCREVLLDAGVPPERCPILNLGYSSEINRVKDSLYLPAGRSIKLLSVTNANDLNRYGTDLLLQGFEKGFHPTDDVSLILRDYGGYSQELAREVERLKAAGYDVLYYACFLNKEDMVRFYRGCDLFVAPFRGEGFGVKILDAMACGLPIIAPLYGGPADYLNAANCLPVRFKKILVGDCLDTRALQLGNSPTWCEVDVDDLAAKLSTACTDLDRMRRLAEQAQQHVIQRFSWQTIAQELVYTSSNSPY